MIINKKGLNEYAVYHGEAGTTDERGRPLHTVSFSGSLMSKQCPLEDLKFRGDETFVSIRVPIVVERLVTKKVLVMSFVKGRPAKYCFDSSKDKASIDESAEMIMRGFLHQVIVDREAHGDPHPANIMFSPNLQPAVVDFGLCLKLDPVVVKGWTKAVYGITQMKADMLFEGCTDLGFKPDPDSEQPPIQQMFELFGCVFPTVDGNKLDRAELVRRIYKHDLASIDLLFILRISNYVAHLCKGQEALRLMTTTYGSLCHKVLYE